MNRDDHAGNIHQLRAARPRVPQNIIVPGKSSDGERQKPVANAARKNKIVDVVSRALHIGAQGIRTYGFGPARLRKIEWLIPIEVPSPANHHEFFRPGANAIESRNNIIGQNNVGIHITKQRRGGVLFGLAEEVAQQRRAELVARNFRKMAESQLVGDFRRALFAAKKKYFRPRDEARPTRDGIALDRRNMSAEILRYGKQGEHLECQEYFLMCRRSQFSKQFEKPVPASGNSSSRCGVSLNILSSGRGGVEIFLAASGRLPNRSL